MEPEAKWEIPPAMQGTERSLYFYRGNHIYINRTEIPSYQAIHLDKEYSTKIKNGNEESFLLFLQGRPIKETVVQYGPFVMNSREEIQQAFDDYRKTEFGGWPWPRPDQVHGREKGRFAKYADGKEERK